MRAELIGEKDNYWKFIQNYNFIEDNGGLDLEKFCVTLAGCFEYDGISSLSPGPKRIYDLLIELLHEELESGNPDKFIQKQELSDWKTEHASVYPNKYRTFIHIAGLIQINDIWIYKIGHNLMAIPESTDSVKYFAWAKEEWQYVFAFINGYHNFFYNFLKKFDLKHKDERGHSSFEALYLASNSSISYDTAVQNLKTRNGIYADGLLQIANAINDKYFLEAIALEEALITHCLYNYLKAQKLKNINTSFFKLLKIFEKEELNTKLKTSTLLDGLDTWRKNRNVSIHGFVTAREKKFTKAKEEFITFSEETANIGYKLTLDVVEWYSEESIEFLKTNFD